MTTSNDDADTPRTNAALLGVWYRGDHGSAIPALCRELERENTRLQSEYLALVRDRDRLDALDKLVSREKWNLQLAHGCVFLCRNSTSGFSDVRKAIDAGIARLLK